MLIGAFANALIQNIILEQGLATGKFYFCVMGNKHWYIQVGAKTFDYSLNILTTSSAIITNENSSLFSSFFKNFYDGLSGFPM